LIDPLLKQYATAKQLVYIDKINTLGSHRKAAAALGIGRQVMVE
jgi:hypothetical protein